MTRTLVDPIRHLAATAAFTALSCLPGIAQATGDWTAVAPTCTPDSAQTLEFGLTSKTGGYIRAGRNPPVLYFCPIHHADDFDSDGRASWNTLSLQYLDPNLRGGNVIARLYRKHRLTGAVSQVVSLASVADPAIQVVKKTFKPLNVKQYAHYVTIEMALSAGETLAEAHMVALTTE